MYPLLLHAAVSWQKPALALVKLRKKSTQSVDRWGLPSAGEASLQMFVCRWGSVWWRGNTASRLPSWARASPDALYWARPARCWTAAGWGSLFYREEEEKGGARVKGKEFGCKNLKRDRGSPCLTNVWLVSNRMSQPSTIILSMARFFRMFSVSLTSSCIILKAEHSGMKHPLFELSG